MGIKSLATAELFILKNVLYSKKIHIDDEQPGYTDVLISITNAEAIQNGITFLTYFHTMYVPFKIVHAKIVDTEAITASFSNLSDVIYAQTKNAINSSNEITFDFKINLNSLNIITQNFNTRGYLELIIRFSD